MSELFMVEIPAIPPGINQTYIRTATGVTLSKDARDWDAKAALIIGAKAGELDWKHEPDQTYGLVIRWGGTRHDNDAHLKLIQDTLTRKLDFDDRLIDISIIEKCPKLDAIKILLAPAERVRYGVHWPELGQIIIITDEEDDAPD